MGFFMDWSAEPWASPVGFLTGEATQGEWQGEWTNLLVFMEEVTNYLDSRFQVDIIYQVT